MHTWSYQHNNYIMYTLHKDTSKLHIMQQPSCLICDIHSLYEHHYNGIHTLHQICNIRCYGCTSLRQILSRTHCKNEFLNFFCCIAALWSHPPIMASVENNTVHPQSCECYRTSPTLLFFTTSLLTTLLSPQLNGAISWIRNDQNFKIFHFNHL